MDTDDAGGVRDAPRYDAFISYRHVEPDRGWARWLQGSLESFRTPRALVRSQGLRRRLSRVFRDEDELPASSDLGTEIETALRQSRFLIVVCSPRTPESAWVNQEIVRFREMGRDDRILALLVEGEPGEAFPQALREIRRHVTDAAGRTREEIEEVEPLAADVRPTRTDPPRWLKRMARLRMLACLLGCRFDDLRRREHERRTRRLTMAGGVMVALVALFAGLSFFALRQRAAAETSRRQAHERLLDFNVEQGRRELIAGDRRRALVYLNEAMQGGRDTPLLRFLLARARTVLDPQDLVLGHLEEGEFQFVAFVAADQRVLTVDAASVVRVYDASAGAEVARIDDLDQQVDATRAVLLGDDDRHAVLRVRRDGRPALVGYDLEKLERTWKIEGPPGVPPAKPLAIAGRVLAGGTPNGRLLLLDVETGAERGSVEAHSGPFEALALDAHARRAAALTAEGDILIWDVAGSQLHRPSATHEGVSALHFVEDGRRLLLVGSEGTLLLDTATGGTVAALPASVWNGVGPTVSPDETLVLIQNGYRNVQLWNAALEADPGATPIFDWETGHEDLVSHAAFDGSSQRLATASWDGTLRVWDTVECLERLLLEGHTGGVKHVAWSADARRVVSGATDGTARVWNVEAGALTRTVEGDGGYVQALRLGATEQQVVVATDDGHVAIWDLAEGRLEHGLPPPAGALGATLDRSGRRVVHTFPDGTATVRDVRTGTTLRALRGHTQPIVTARFGPRGEVLTASQDGTARIWDVDGTAEPTVLAAHDRSVFHATMDARSHRVATTGMDESVGVWDRETGERIHELRRTGVVGFDLPAFSPSGERLAARTNDGHVVVWDVETGREQCVLAGHGDRGARGFLFDPAGARIATAGEDGRAVVWDAETGSRLFSLRRPGIGRPGLDDEIEALAFSPDGRFLATAESNALLRIWELGKGRLVQEIEGHGSGTRCCAFTSSGESLLTGNGGGTVQRYDVSLERQSAAAIDRLVVERVPYRLVDGVLMPVAMEDGAEGGTRTRKGR